jgi:hypothetical protein
VLIICAKKYKIEKGAMFKWGEGGGNLESNLVEVPNMVKVCCWRACNNILPTKTNRVHKRVVDNMKSPCCEFEDETNLQVL